MTDPKLTLPLLQADHLKAISSSLPGKLVGRTACLLALIALLLAWWGWIYDWLPPAIQDIRQNHSFYFGIVYYGLPLLIVAFQLSREAWERWQIREIRKRVITGELLHPGYFRLQPYTARDHTIFSRLDNAHHALTNCMLETKCRIIYVTGPSGVGKTSVLDAFCIPTLRQQNWVVVTSRTFSAL